MNINNIYLGDCYELIKQIPDKSIDLIYTDLPYEFASNGGGGVTELKIENIITRFYFKNNKKKIL